MTELTDELPVTKETRLLGYAYRPPLYLTGMTLAKRVRRAATSTRRKQVSSQPIRLRFVLVFSAFDRERTLHSVAW
jgi:hypothetical protein